MSDELLKQIDELANAVSRCAQALDAQKLRAEERKDKARSRGGVITNG